MHNISICYMFSPARRRPMLLLRHLLRVLEGGIKMQARSNLRCRLRLPMRHADTSGLHPVAPCAGYVPDGIRANTVKSLPRRLAPGPYEGPVVLSYLRLKGCLMVAACRYSS